MSENIVFTFLLDQQPSEIFNAINNVRGWWSESLEGGSEKQGDEFIYRYKDLHYSKQRLTEVIPDKKVVWLVTDSHLSFTKKSDEWTGTQIVFDIIPEGNQTKLHFEHIGLTPAVECFDACTGGWSHYLNQSLVPLIATGKGQPALRLTEPVIDK